MLRQKGADLLAPVPGERPVVRVLVLAEASTWSKVVFTFTSPERRCAASMSKHSRGLA